MKQGSKGTHGLDEDGTIGGASTQCAYPHDSQYSYGVKNRNRWNQTSTKEPTSNKIGRSPQKRSNLTRIVDNLNKKKFTTNIDEEKEQIKRKDEEMSLKRKKKESIEPFW